MEESNIIKFKNQNYNNYLNEFLSLKCSGDILNVSTSFMKG